jgi:hypothetical protein
METGQELQSERTKTSKQRLRVQQRGHVGNGPDVRGVSRCEEEEEAEAEEEVESAGERGVGGDKTERCSRDRDRDETGGKRLKMDSISHDTLAARNRESGRYLRP